MLRQICTCFVLVSVLFPLGKLFGAADHLGKVGLIDMRRIWSEYQGMKDVVDELKKETMKRQKVINAEKNSLTTLRADYEKKSVILTEEEKKKKNKEMQEKMMHLREHIMSVNKDLQALDAKLRTKIIEDVKKVVSNYGRKHNLSLVLNKSEAFVLFSSDTLDVTDDIIKKLTEAYGS